MNFELVVLYGYWPDYVKIIFSEVRKIYAIIYIAVSRID